MADVHLIEQISIALGAGLAGGLLARRAGLSPLVGYLGAGVVIGPFTPGYSADSKTLTEVAEIGVIFLMFGVGLHFNVRDLLAVRWIAGLGGCIQMALITAAGVGIGAVFDLGWRAGLVLGLAIAISSTVVMVRALEERGLLETTAGRIAIGWLVVQDLATVLFLAVLPGLAAGDMETFVREAGRDLAVAAVFLVVMLVVGARTLPWALAEIARLGSRELFILAVAAAALGVAAGAAALGLSVALGAFVGGVVISERETSHQAAADVVPLREAFAVLFFVAVGMLLDPEILVDNAGLLIATAVAVVVVKGLVSAGIAAIFPYSAHTALLTGAGLGQIGEFSFIIAGAGVAEGLLDDATYNVILAVAVVSIIVNPILFGGIPVWEGALRRLGPVYRWADKQGASPPPVPKLHRHAVVLGYGRVGNLVGHSLQRLGVEQVVVESDIERARVIGRSGIPVVWGDAGSRDVLLRARVAEAAIVVVCVHDSSTTTLAVAGTREINATVPLVVRARSGDELEELRRLGADHVVIPAYEGGLEVTRRAVAALGFDAALAAEHSKAIRDAHYREGV